MSQCVCFTSCVCVSLCLCVSVCVCFIEFSMTLQVSQCLASFSISLVKMEAHALCFVVVLQQQLCVLTPRLERVRKINTLETQPARSFRRGGKSERLLILSARLSNCHPCGAAVPRFALCRGRRERGGKRWRL